MGSVKAAGREVEDVQRVQPAGGIAGLNLATLTLKPKYVLAA